jgi:hypothetical protein
MSAGMNRKEMGQTYHDCTNLFLPNIKEKFVALVIKYLEKGRCERMRGNNLGPTSPQSHDPSSQIPVTMPVPMKPPLPSNGEPANSQPSRSQKIMTKAERRELQEKQRAAKATRSSGAPTAGSSSPPVKPPPTPPASAALRRKSVSTGRNSDAGLTKSSSSQAKDSSSVRGAGEEDGAGKSRGLRIFSHFGLPSRSVSHVVKGDIHPAIVRLGLQFSEFKISGANARCIATLAAFKAVRVSLTVGVIHG